MPSMPAAFPMEKCPSSETYRHIRLPAAATPSRTTLAGAFALRAAASAAKLAIEPPLVNRPTASAG